MNESIQAIRLRPANLRGCRYSSSQYPATVGDQTDGLDNKARNNFAP